MEICVTKLINPITINNRLYPDSLRYDEPLEDADALVIATANTIHITEYPKLQDVVESITKRVMVRNVPTIVLGLGIQAEFDDDMCAMTASTAMNLTATPLKLPFWFQKEFLLEISKRQRNPAVGVRGDFTETVCRNSNIYNCVSMGCPSLTISRDVHLGSTLQKNWKNLIVQVKEKKTIRIALAMPAYSSSTYGIKLSNNIYSLYASVLQQHGYDSVTVIEQSASDGRSFKEYIDTVWNKDGTKQVIATEQIKLKEYYSVESWLKGAEMILICAYQHVSMVQCHLLERVLSNCHPY